MLIYKSLLILLLANVSSLSPSSSEWLSKQPHLIKTGFTNIIWEYISSNDFEVNNNLTKKCKLSLNHVNQSANEGQEWPIKMFEASGRIPDDFSRSGFADLGDFDKCQQLTYTSYNGNNKRAAYCLNSFEPKDQNINENIYTENKIFTCKYGACIKIGFCLPSECSSTDLKIILSKALQPYDWNVFSVDHCSTYKTFNEKLAEASKNQKIFLFLLSSIIFIVLIANIIYIAPTLNSNEKQSKWVELLSFKSSYRQIIEPNWSSNKMFSLLQYTTILHSVVLLLHIILWAILIQVPTLIVSLQDTIHTHVTNPFIYFFTGDWYTQGIFFYGGATRSLDLWRQIKPSTTLSKLIFSILTKLFSLSMMIFFILLFHVNMHFLFSSGPLDIVDRQSSYCLDNLWKSLTFRENHVENDARICLNQFWSVSVESQFFLALGLLIFLQKRYPKIGFTVNLLTIFGSFCYIGYSYYNNPYPVFALEDPLNIDKVIIYALKVYINSFANAWVYAVGTLIVFLIMNDYHRIIPKFPLIRILYSKIYLFGTAMFCIQPIYIYLIRPYETRLIHAIVPIVYRIICLVFWILVGFRVGDETKKVFGDAVEGEKSKDEPIDPKKLKKIRLYSMISTLLRSVYCIHATTLSIGLNTLRKPLTTMLDMFLFLGLQFIGCLIGGLLFHFFVLGPFTSIFVYMKNKKTKSQ